MALIRRAGSSAAGMVGRSLHQPVGGSQSVSIITGPDVHARGAKCPAWVGRGLADATERWRGVAIGRVDFGHGHRQTHLVARHWRIRVSAHFVHASLTHEGANFVELS